MSTLEQTKGDSSRRQMEASARYAAKNKLRIVEGDEAYEDIGVSAFKGKHIKDGALGRFLTAVHDGKIQRGSYLLVESLDRVSRQSPYDAAPIMRDIVEAGINVVDLSDNEKLYNSEILRSDSTVYMRMVVRFERAHEESKTKSERVKEAWSAKRDRARDGNHKLTKWCPAWLKLSKDRQRYEVVAKNADTVKWIFYEAAEGRGIFAIARRLNQRSFPAFGKSRGWHPSYVIKILKNPAVLGRYQPTKVAGRAATEDELAQHSIENYYPAIISEELFYRVQQALSERRHTGAGRKGEHYTNLFTGLRISCAYCGGHVRFENKGAGLKGGLYLVCDDARRAHNCNAQRWRYQHFEEALLSFVHHELDYSAMREGPQNAAGLLVRDIEAQRGRITQLLQKRQRRIDLVDRVGADVVAPEINRLTAEIKSAESGLAGLEREHDEVTARAAVLMRGPEHLNGLIETLNDNQADLYAVRSQLGKVIKGLVSEIIMGAGRQSSGGQVVLHDGEVVDQFDSLQWARDDRERLDSLILMARLHELTGLTRYYVVRFKDGVSKLDVPPANPLHYPLAGEKTEAVVFLFTDGTIQVVEHDDLPAFWADNAPGAPGITHIGVVSSNLRTGTVNLAQS
jgi:DNA invertase Pin-like site-specific DNA recombinase